jgi:hypothetical protein
MRSAFVRIVSGTTAAAVLSLSVPALAQGYLPPQQQPPQQQQPPPPPQSATTPRGEYVTPMQQQTQQTYVPQSVAMTGPRVINDYHDGDPIPPGYHPQQRVRGGLVGGGAGLFGALWLIDVIIAAADASIKQDCNFSLTGADICTNHKATFWPLWIPVAGPFIAIGTTGSDALGTTFLVIDGLAQAGGVAMIIAGAMGHTVLVRNDLGAPKLELKPMFGMGATHSGHGMGLQLNF